MEEEDKDFNSFSMLAEVFPRAACAPAGLGIQSLAQLSSQAVHSLMGEAGTQRGWEVRKGQDRERLARWATHTLTSEAEGLGLYPGVTRGLDRDWSSREQAGRVVDCRGTHEARQQAGVAAQIKALRMARDPKAVIRVQGASGLWGSLGLSEYLRGQ